MDSHPDLNLPPDLRPETVMDPPALYAALEYVRVYVYMDGCFGVGRCVMSIASFYL